MITDGNDILNSLHANTAGEGAEMDANRIDENVAIQRKVAEKLKTLFNIRGDMAPPEEIRARITSNAQISGTNMYVLIAAIIIASIGLNMNSTAVIIGAMLISPLMGSIIGIGYGMSTKQTAFTKRSFEGLLWQLGIALATSTIYFLISPITAPSEEILARTSPTVWDVLIAFFGGAAGIIGQTRKEKSNNIIPGVAIATALMPPVCTAGYGIANGKWTVMAGALDLFLVNCLCIFLTTFLFTKLLKIDDTPDDMTFSKKLRVRVAILVVLVFIPTGYFAYDYVANQHTENNITAFINEQFVYEDTQVIKHSYNKENNILTVTLVGSAVEEEEISAIRSSLADYGLDGITLKITQTNSDKTISAEEVDDLLEKRLNEIRQQLNSVEEENSSLAAGLEEMREENESLQNQLDELTTAEETTAIEGESVETESTTVKN